MLSLLIDVKFLCLALQNSPTFFCLLFFLFFFFPFISGYGTFAPKTLPGQIFLVLFSLIGIPLSGVTLVNLADNALAFVTKLFANMMGSDTVQKAFDVFDTGT